MAFIRKVQKPTGDRWYVYWREHGRQKAKVFKDEAAALEFFLEKDGGASDPSAVPFSKFWKRYLDERAKRKLTPKVFRTYERMGERLIVPYFGERPLSSIRRSDTPEWITWAEGKAEAGSVQKAYTVLTSCLTYAVNLDLIPANPARGWGDHLPKVKGQRRRPHLPPAQVKKLADEVDIVFQAMLLSMGILGLRPSEAIALRVGDLDLEKDVLHVRRSAVDVDGTMVARNTTKGGTEEKPKGRTIPLMGLEDEFGAHLIEKFALWEQEPSWDLNEAIREHADDLMFTSKFSRNKAGLINEDALNKLVREAGERIGVAGLAVSDLRHIANANIIELTGDVTFASRVLGNSPEINLRHYDAGTTVRWTEAIRKVSQGWADA